MGLHRGTRPGHQERENIVNKVVAGAVIVIALAAVGSTMNKTPAAATDAPTVAAPVSGQASWSTFKDHAITASSEWAAQLGVVSDASGSGDFAEARSAMSGLLTMANAEQRWLSSHPSDACYSAVYSKWSQAIGLFEQSASYGIDGIDGLDPDLLGMATSTMERATGVITEASGLLHSVSCQ